jgi:ketosteroid isomerase-like protein
MKNQINLWLMFFLIIFCTTNCKERKIDVQSDLANIEKVIRDFPKTAESYDFETIQTLLEPNLVWIEEAPPVAFDKIIDMFKMFDSLKVQIAYSELRDLKIQEQGDIAWAYWIVDGSFKTDTEKGRSCSVQLQVQMNLRKLNGG